MTTMYWCRGITVVILYCTGKWINARGECQ